MKKAGYTFKELLTATAVSSALALGGALTLSAAAIASIHQGVLKGEAFLTIQSKAAPANNPSINAQNEIVVTITNINTGISRTKTLHADSQCNSAKYVFPNLPIGEYEVKSFSKANPNFVQRNIVSVTTHTAFANSQFSIDAAELKRLPIERNIASVAMLAPGAVLGDKVFADPMYKGHVSLGGASIAENVQFVNGLNISNFKNGLVTTKVPFDFYQQIDVQTGGYSVRYAYSMGGMINTVTKSGTNEWQANASIYHTPSSLFENTPNTGNELDQDAFNERTEGSISLSGPIIKDELFFYVLYNPRDVQTNTYSNNYLHERFENKANLDNTFWSGKLDWAIYEGHQLELTAFSDTRSTQIHDSKLGGEQFSRRGGTNVAFNYTGEIYDNLTLSIFYGNVQQALTDGFTTDQTCPVIIDIRVGGFGNAGCWKDGVPSTGSESRTTQRFELQYALDEHQFRAGIEESDNITNSNTFYSGHIYYRYLEVAAGDQLRGKPFEEDTDTVRVRVYENGGEFKSLAKALYIEDEWTVSDKVTLTLGLRSDSFKNYGANSNVELEATNQIAPRAAIEYSIDENNQSTLYANAGRYYMPIPSQISTSMFGEELFTEKYFILDGLNPDQTPIFYEGSLFDSRIYQTSYYIPDFREYKDHDITAPFQDEYIVGYRTNINYDWQVGVKGTLRNLGATLDNITIDEALKKREIYHDHQTYVIANPGEDVSVWYDTNQDDEFSNIEFYTFTADELGYEKVKRIYTALEFTASRAWQGDWSVNASYVWSQSKGNDEGYVQSDTGDDRSGITTEWDFPQMLDGANAQLPNDRTHQIKVNGAYRVNEQWVVAANLNMTSGRPINKFGHSYPNDNEWDSDQNYTTTFYQASGEFNERGSQGRTKAITNLDLKASYETNFKGATVTLAVDVFNVFNAQTETSVDEMGEVQIAENSDFVPNANYGQPTSYQTPRRVQFSASVSF